MPRKWLRNIIKAPVVLLIRVPVLSLFWILMMIGKQAEKASDWAIFKLSGFDR